MSEPQSGDIYECVKSNKRHGTVKGKFYVLDHGDLKTFTTRNVTSHANGDEILEQSEAFELARFCPFCGISLPFPNHDGVKCAAQWDAKTKNYCLECNGDTVDGICANCTS